MGGINFTQTLHDSKTIPEVMEQFLRLSGSQAKVAFADRGIPSNKTILRHHNPCECSGHKHHKSLAKKTEPKRSIKPVIGHLKQDYRPCRNYLKGIIGDNIKVMMLVTNLQIHCRSLREFFYAKILNYFLRDD